MKNYIKQKNKIGLVIDGTDHFIEPIEIGLINEGYRVQRFNPKFIRLPLIGQRVNVSLLIYQLKDFFNKNDVVLFEWAGYLAGLASQRSCRAKRIIRAHRNEIFTNLNNIDWSNIEKVIFVSHAMRSHFLERFPQFEEKTTVIYNGVNLGKFCWRPKPFTWKVGMLGNLTPRKRVYDVICTLADLPPEIPWQLIVGGPVLERDYDYWISLLRVVSKMGIEKKVTFCGNVLEPNQWFNQIDIYISASYSEGQQVSLLEAMASGCYCLGHCWDGVEEVLPKEYIYTTPADLCEKLMYFASLPAPQKEKAQMEFRRIVEDKFDEQRMIRSTINVIEELVLRKKRILSSGI